MTETMFLSDCVSVCVCGQRTGQSDSCGVKCYSAFFQKQSGYDSL